MYNVGPFFSRESVLVSGETNLKKTLYIFVRQLDEHY